MADSTLEVIVKFIGDTKSLGDEMGKVEGSGNKLGGVLKGVAAGVAGAFAIGQVKDFIGAASESEKATNTLNQTLKNAGDSTGEWSKHAQNLSDTLSKQTGVDDEIISGGQAILATFHEVSNAAGQTSGVFDRATKAAVDMSAAGFGSVESASTMLGKALNDPIKGITALGKAGVTFTDQQKEQIKTLVQSGKTLDAQKVILENVESQVGGTAAASATASDKMAVAFGNTEEAIGAALIPALEMLMPIIQKTAEFIQDNSSWLVPLAAAILAVVAAVKIWTVVQAIINAELFANPIGLVILAIVALVAAIVILIKNWDTVAAAFGTAWNFILDLAKKVWNWIKDNWPLLLGILTGPIGIAVALITKNWDTIKNALSTAIDFMRTLWDNFVGFLTSIPGRVWNALISIKDRIADIFQQGFDNIKAIVGGIIVFFYGLPDRIISALGGLAGRLFDIGKEWINHLIDGVKSMAGSLVDAVKGVAGKAIDFFNPFNSPETRAFYTGQAVVADFIRGIESKQAMAIGSLAAVGNAMGPTKRTPVGNGPRTINLNITMQAGSDPVETGKTIVRYIRQFERANGTSWRENPVA